VLIAYDGNDKKYLKTIVARLDSMLVGHLTIDGTTKYMGVCKLRPNATGRRIDIRIVTSSSLGAALLYFTGSDKFNKIMRYFANQRGFTLNEYGLYEYINGVKGELVPAETEEDIFSILNTVYLTPEQREF
jgi:DNA polymerase/3'-5' exonuclease PolX